MTPLDFTRVDPWPYPRHEYLLRILWNIVYGTLWQIAWGRITFLRCALLRIFGAKLPLDCYFVRSVRISRPWDLVMGHRCAVGQRVHLYNLGGLEIGDQTVISQDAYLCGGTHDYTDPAYRLIRKKITIGHSVWIAAGAFISPGVTIHHGAVVAARAVVVKDVDEWTIVGGNPARFIKQRPVPQGAAAPVSGR